MAYAGKNFGGFKVMAGLVRGGGGAEPPDAGEFSKICKKILKKIAKKYIIFAYFAKNFKTLH